MQTWPEHCLALVSWSSFLVWNQLPLSYVHELIMMTSSSGNIFRVTGLCAVHTPVTGEFPSQKPVTRIFDVFLDLRPNKRSSKESRGWWFGTPSRSLWRYCNVNRWTDWYGSGLFPKSLSSYMVWAPNFQSLWPSGVIWRHTPLWTLVQVIIWTDVDWSVSAHDIHLSAISTINH